MAYTLSRIDRKARTYELSATVLAQAAEVPPDLTGVDVALLPKRSSPTAATVWYPAEYADGSFTVLLAGPDADSTGALVVPADADLWMRIADSPEVDAEKLERITVLGGGAVIEAPTGVPVISVNGHQGATLILDADDVGAIAPGDGAGGILSGSFPNPGANTAAFDALIAGAVNDDATDTSVALRTAFDAPRRRSLVTQPGRSVGPVFTKVAGPILTATAAGLGSIYYPSVLSVRDVLPAFSHTYAMLLSTDHDATGGIYLAKSNDLRTWTTPALVYRDTTAGQSTETPSVWWNPTEELFFMLYQQIGGGGVGGQTTLLATSPNLTTWTRVGVAIDVYGTADSLGTETHTGYARVSQLGDGVLVAHHLLAGGVYSRRAMSYSNNGRRWRFDPRPIEANPHLATDSTRKIVLNEVFWWDGQLWGLGVDKDLSAGSDPNTSIIVIGRVDPDLRNFAEVPRPAIELGTQVWESSDVRSTHIFSDNGRLYLFYQTDNNFGLAISEVAA